MPDKQDLVTKIRVRVNPGASRTQLMGVEDGVYKIRLAAPPVKGKANKELRNYIAKLVGVRKADVEINAGEHARMKTISIRGIEAKEVASILSKS